MKIDGIWLAKKWGKFWKKNLLNTFRIVSYSLIAFWFIEVQLNASFFIFIFFSTYFLWLLKLNALPQMRDMEGWRVQGDGTERWGEAGRGKAKSINTRIKWSTLKESLNCDNLLPLQVRFKYFLSNRNGTRQQQQQQQQGNWAEWHITPINPIRSDPQAAAAALSSNKQKPLANVSERCERGDTWAPVIKS